MVNTAARSVPLTRADFSIFRVLPTRWADNDIYGHVNNVVHYALFDTAVNGWLIEAGLLDIKSGETVGLVVETGCSYFAEMTFPDIIHAGLRITRIGTSSVAYEIGLFRNDEQTASAQGRFVHVYVDRKSRKPQPLDDRWRNKLGVLLR
jgi:acyl-CoA thioester hydrolase